MQTGQTEKAITEEPTMKDAEELTVGELMAFIKSHGLDREEYFDPDRGMDMNEPLWPDNPCTRWVICFARRGSSLAAYTCDGWYVHVERIDRNHVSTNIALGKFWNSDSAVMAVSLISRLLLTGRPAIGS